MNELVHINILFSESVYTDFNSKKLGLDLCKEVLDINTAYDLKKLLERSLEQETCNENDSCCSLEKLKEKINTL